MLKFAKKLPRDISEASNDLEGARKLEAAASLVQRKQQAATSLTTTSLSAADTFPIHARTMAGRSDDDRRPLPAFSERSSDFDETSSEGGDRLYLAPRFLIPLPPVSAPEGQTARFACKVSDFVISILKVLILGPD